MRGSVEHKTLMSSNWDKYNDCLLRYPELEFSIDTSRMGFPGDYFKIHREIIGRAYADMDDLEAGGIANPDEENDEGEMGRQVGHYWLRNSERAPKEHQDWIEEVKAQVESLAEEVHSGARRAVNGNLFREISQKYVDKRIMTLY